MKIRPLSDLHSEFYSDPLVFLKSLPHPDAKVLVLAGDIGVASPRPDRLTNTLRFFKDIYENVLYVPGNHEFYGRHPADAILTLRDIAHKTKVALLEPGKVIEIDGHTFRGATLWFREVTLNRDELITDFHIIKEFVPWVFRENEKHRTWLSTVNPGDVVVTHHLPSPKSIAELYREAYTNKFFVCDMEPLIEQQRPALWIHGHTHHFFDYKLGETRVVSNPAGYPDHHSGKLENQAFNPNLIIEL